MTSPRRFKMEKEKDLMSELPNKVIERILECMPLKDAVRTSILSRSWRYNWVTLPKLMFDDIILFRSIKEKFVNVVNAVLLLHTGPIRSFVLRPVEFWPEYYADFIRWMHFLSSNGVRELTLNNSCCSTQNIMQLPSGFFSCRELTSLKLFEFIFKAPPAFLGFQYLTAIDFRGIIIERETFETVVSSALHLESLTVINCSGVEHANITASNLKYLDVEFKSVIFNNMPNLVKSRLILRETADSSEWRNSNLIMIADRWPKLERLSLGYFSFKVLAAGYVPRNLQAKFHHLKRLDLRFITFQNVTQFACAICLIQSSPNLQELEIKDMVFPAAALKPVSNYLKGPDCVDCILPMLQKVRIEGVNIGAEIPLIKYFLAMSPVLATMFILYNKRIQHNEEYMLLRTLLKFCRASPIAEVICEASS